MLPTPLVRVLPSQEPVDYRLETCLTGRSPWPVSESELASSSVRRGDAAYDHHHPGDLAGREERLGHQDAELRALAELETTESAEGLRTNPS